METRSNYVLVGSVVLALLAGAAAVHRLARRPVEQDRASCFDIYFTQGVGGLNKGSSVTFSGVPVGQIDEDLAASRPAGIRLGADRGR